MIDEVFLTPGIKFSAIVINKDNIDFKKLYNNDPYKAYESFSETLICKNLSNNEVLIILADYISTPLDIHFEVDIKHKINESFKRLAIAGVHRVESNGINLVQLADLFLGAVVYEYKVKNKIVVGDKNKIEIFKYILEMLRIKTFIGGINQKIFKVIEHE